jgi:GT2 family glycosyltransferase
MIDISVIIINFNTADLTAKCVSLFSKELRDISHEMIVIDNGSRRSDVSKLRSKLSKRKGLVFVENRYNYGFAKANNIGLQHSTGRYVLFLNSDTLPDKVNFREIISWLDENPDVGAMGCMLKNQDGSIQGNGGYFPELMKVALWMLFIDDIPFLDNIVKPFHPHHPKSFVANNRFYSKKREVDWITGAFLIARREAIGNGFDEDYFMYGEDVDLCKNIKDKGYRVIYNPKWSIIHLGGKSSSSSYPIIAEFNSLKLYYKKHKGGFELFLLLMLLRLGILMRYLLFIFTRKEALSRAYAQALREV